MFQLRSKLGTPFKFFLIGIVGGGVQLGPLVTEATNRPVVPAPGDYDDGELGGIWQWKPKYSEKTCLSAALSTTNSTCYPDANPGCRGGKPATNRLSYGTAWEPLEYKSSWTNLLDIFLIKSVM
jgi:hypothetical protein